MASSRPPRSLHRIGLSALAAGLLALTLTGCVRLLEPRPSNITYYLLHSTSADTLSTNTSGVEVGLRKPRLPSYLDATRIVTRRDSNEVHFSEFQRWGEDLGRAVNRVVALNLEAQRGIQSAKVVPWSEGPPFDYVVQLEVLRFEGNGPAPPGPEADDDVPIPRGHSQMAVQWTIYGPDEKTMQGRGLTRHQQGDWPVNEYSALVSRLNASLEVLADDIGTRLRALTSQ